MGGGNTGAASPQRIIADLISGGACERFPDLHFNLVEFSAGWLVSYVGFMDRSWRTGIGQDPNWWLGFWDDSRPPSDQPAMGRLFAVNSKWPLPLKPSDYGQAAVPRAVRGRTGRSPGTAHHRAVDHRVG